jgi:O-antigen/teichoic acid export membrane protein
MLIGVVALAEGHYGFGVAFVVVGGLVTVRAVWDFARAQKRGGDELSPARLIGAGAVVLLFAGLLALRDPSLGDPVWGIIGLVLIVLGAGKHWRTRRIAGRS